MLIVELFVRSGRGTRRVYFLQEFGADHRAFGCWCTDCGKLWDTFGALQDDREICQRCRCKKRSAG